MTQKSKSQSLDASSAVAQSEAFIIKHRNPIIIAAVVLVVLIGGFFALKAFYWGPRGEKAATMLALGEDYFAAGDFETALKGDKQGFVGYEKIAKDYAHTDAGNLANFYAGICYAQQGKDKEAIPYLEAFDTQDDVTISPAALNTLANCYASTNQLDKAVATFREAAKLSGHNSLAPICLKEAAQILESQNKKAEALTLYQQIKSEYGTSITAQDIDKYIERVSK